MIIFIKAIVDISDFFFGEENFTIVHDVFETHAIFFKVVTVSCRNFEKFQTILNRLDLLVDPLVFFFKTFLERFDSNFW